jgi:hypothetical protein
LSRGEAVGPESWAQPAVTIPARGNSCRTWRKSWRSCGSKGRRPRKESNNWTGPWKHLLASADYGQQVEVRNRERSGERCLLRPARRLLRPSAPAGQNGKLRENPELRKKKYTSSKIRACQRRQAKREPSHSITSLRPISAPEWLHRSR